MPGDKLLVWHREKAGTIEHVHDEIKNALGGGHMPTTQIGLIADVQPGPGRAGAADGVRGVTVQGIRSVGITNVVAMIDAVHMFNGIRT